MGESQKTVAYDVERVRAEFPCLEVEVNGYPIAYLDNASTAQKPRKMIEATRAFYESQYSNVHRGVHTLSQNATDLFEHVRERVRIVLDADSTDEIIFTKGCTEGINLVAQSFARPRLRPCDEILLTELEHHSNIVPWQLVAEQTGARIRVAPINDDGHIDMDRFEALLNPKTKIAAFVHISNAIGTINPVRRMAAAAKRVGATVLIDGAQGGPHCAVSVREIDADFYTLSCHKMYAPTGIGILYGRRELLEAMPPYQGGGSMIRSVTFEGTTYAELPDKFEPGTPNIAGFIGFGATLDFLAGLGGLRDGETFCRAAWERGMASVAEHEAELLKIGTKLLNSIEGLRLFGTQPDKAAILSFELAGAHPHDIGHILDGLGIAVRTGHHCCQPLMTRFGVPATTRASLGLYNTFGELERLAEGVEKVREIFR
jgi:cysteine desulfurase/selenocysteine lyase